MKRVPIFGQPTLFEDFSEGANRKPDVNSSQSAVQKNTPALQSQTRPISSGTRISQYVSRAETSGPKRRKTYQWGTLYPPEPRKRGPWVWPYRYSETVDGRRKRRKVIVGTVVEYPDRPDALRACEHLRMRANSENPLSNATMRGLIDRVIEEVIRPSLDIPLGGEVDEDADLEYSSARNYRSAIKCHILPKWGGYRVKDFEKPEIQNSVEKWLRSLRRSMNNPTGLESKSVGQVAAALRVVFKFGVKWGYLSFNPFSDKRIQPPRGCTKRSKKPVQLSPAQFLLLMSNLAIREQLAVTFDGWMASRISEPFGVKWEDVDLQSQTVRFKRGYVQGRFSRLKTEPSRGEFSLPEEVVELLCPWREITPYNRASDFVFGSPHTKGRPFSPRTLMKKIQPVAQALGLPHIGWHSLRHSFCRWAKDAGLTLDDIKTLARHQTSKMASEVYGGPELATTRKLQARVMKYVKKEGVKSKPEQNGLYLPLKTA